MKKYSILAVAAICGACLFVSCNKEKDIQPEENIPAQENPAESPQDNAGEAVMVFSASLDDSAETKTYITTPEGSGPNEGKYVPKWNSSDKIKVNGVQSAAGVRSADFTSASFSFSEEVTGPFYAIAPSADNRTWDAENTRYSIIVSGTGSPQVYRNYVDGSSDARGTNPTYDMSHAVLAAYSETTSLQFQQLTTYFKLTFTKGAGVASGTKIKTIYVRQGEAADTPNIGGSWRVSFDGSGVASITPGSLTAIIAYNCLKNGGTDIEGVEFGTPVIITLPSYNFEHGLIITVKDTEGHFQSFGIPKTSSNLATKKGTLITKTLTYNPQSGTISSAEDWNAFAAAVNSSDDWALYKWAGNGKVYVKSFTADRALTQIIGGASGFSLDVDGTNGDGVGGPAVITRTGSHAAIEPLFDNIHGTVSNIQLNGEMSATGQSAAFVKELFGTLQDCTNNMTITHNGETDGSAVYLSGFACVMHSGSIYNCQNTGTLTLSPNCSTKSLNAQLAGIVGQIAADAEDVTISKCTNTNTLTMNPTITSSDASYSLKLGSLAGILAWNRSSNKVTISNCDNSGALKWNEASSPNYRRAICIGGIIGIGAPISANNGKLLSDLTQRIQLEDCDNTGNITCMALVDGANNNNIIKILDNKVNVGGIAGALLGGTSENKAIIDNCSNFNTITSYNIADGSDQAGVSAMLGGLVGWGGNIDFRNKTRANCTIGDGIRQSFSVAGVLGCAVAPFTMQNCYIRLEGKWNRVPGCKGNRAMVAVIPLKYSTADTQFGASNSQPTVEGTSITNCQLGGSLYTSTSTYTDKEDHSSNASTRLFMGSSDITKVTNNLVCGEGFTANTGVTFSDISYWSGTGTPWAN